MKANKIIICILATAVVLYGCATLSTGTLGTLAEVEKYDENGNKVYARNELGVKEWKYDGSGKVVYAKDTSIGSEMWIDYDGEGKMTYRKSVVKNPRGAVSEVEEVWYDAHENEIKRVSNGRERKTVLEYDSAGNVIHRVEGWGNELWYEYDERGNRTREKCALYDFFTDYDKYGNETHIVHIFAGSGGFEEYWIEHEYDERGNVLHSKNTKSREEYFFDYDGQERCVYERHIYAEASRQVMGEETEEWRKYDERGNLVHTKSSRGGEYWYEYDEKGNLTRSTDNDGGETRYVYSFYKNGAVKTVKTYTK